MLVGERAGRSRGESTLSPGSFDKSAPFLRSNIKQISKSMCMCVFGVMSSARTRGTDTITKIYKFVISSF